MNETYDDPFRSAYVAPPPAARKVTNHIHILFTDAARSLVRESLQGIVFSYPIDIAVPVIGDGVQIGLADVSETFRVKDRTFLYGPDAMEVTLLLDVE